jgi:hypothetical protein
VHAAAEQTGFALAIEDAEGDWWTVLLRRGAG